MIVRATVGATVPGKEGLCWLVTAILELLSERRCRYLFNSV